MIEQSDRTPIADNYFKQVIEANQQMEQHLYFIEQDGQQTFAYFSSYPATFGSFENIIGPM